MYNNHSKQSMLVLSTAHISLETKKGLEADNLPIVAYAKSAYGWFIPVTEESDEIKHLPADLRGIVEFAASNGCDWIMLDSDYDEIQCLPTFNW